MDVKSAGGILARYGDLQAGLLFVTHLNSLPTLGTKVKPISNVDPPPPTFLALGGHPKGHTIQLSEEMDNGNYVLCFPDAYISVPAKPSSILQFNQPAPPIIGTIVGAKNGVCIWAENVARFQAPPALVNLATGDLQGGTTGPGTIYSEWEVVVPRNGAEISLFNFSIHHSK